MSILRTTAEICKKGGCTVEEIIDPITEKGTRTRDSLIIEYRNTYGWTWEEISEFTGLPIDYIKGVVRKKDGGR